MTCRQWPNGSADLLRKVVRVAPGHLGRTLFLSPDKHNNTSQTEQTERIALPSHTTGPTIYLHPYRVRKRVVHVAWRQDMKPRSVPPLCWLKLHARPSAFQWAYTPYRCAYGRGADIEKVKHIRREDDGLLTQSCLMIQTYSL